MCYVKCFQIGKGIVPDHTRSTILTFLITKGDGENGWADFFIFPYRLMDLCKGELLTDCESVCNTVITDFFFVNFFFWAVFLAVSFSRSSDISGDESESDVSTDTWLLAWSLTAHAIKIRLYLTLFYLTFLWHKTKTINSLTVLINCNVSCAKKTCSIRYLVARGLLWHTDPLKILGSQLRDCKQINLLFYYTLKWTFFW